MTTTELPPTDRTDQEPDRGAVERPAAPPGRAGSPGRRTVVRRTVKGVTAALVVVVPAVLVIALATATSGSPDGTMVDGGGTQSSAPATGVFAEPAAPSDSAGRATNQGAPATAAPGTADAIGPDRAVIRQASVRLTVADPASSGADVRAAVTAAGGYVADERSSGGRADLVVKVPAAGLDALLNRIAGLGTVTDRSSTARDVTDQLVDTDARVASRRASVDRVRALLAQASSISEIVSIESELTQRQADLDSMERRLAALRTGTDLATVDVALLPAGAPPVADAGTGFGAGLGVGGDWLRGIGSAMAATAGFVVPLLPVVAVFALLAWGTRRVVRSRRARPTPAPAGSQES